MKSPPLDTPLSEDELDRLDEFLVDRMADDAETDGKDEGILCVSELDGFLTATVSAPEIVPPSRWIPAIWGDLEPAWTSLEEANEIMALILRHSNTIATLLMEDSQVFEPMFDMHLTGEGNVTVADEWCEGYIRGVAVDAATWANEGAHMDAMLDPIRAFTSLTRWSGHTAEDLREHERLCAGVTASARRIHAYWLSKRAVVPEFLAPAKAAASHRSVGRNDPCPCGSGKNFKKCCLQ